MEVRGQQKFNFNQHVLVARAGPNLSSWPAVNGGDERTAYNSNLHT